MLRTGSSGTSSERARFGPLVHRIRRVVASCRDESRDGGRHGVNDYTGWFAGDKEMAGDYYGYDGPCPPWNDAIVHHYTFTLYALDVTRLSVDGKFTGNDVRNAMRSHMLAAAKVSGRYTLNPSVRM